LIPLPARARPNALFADSWPVVLAIGCPDPRVLWLVCVALSLPRNAKPSHGGLWLERVAKSRLHAFIQNRARHSGKNFENKRLGCRQGRDSGAYGANVQ